MGSRSEGLAGWGRWGVDSNAGAHGATILEGMMAFGSGELPGAKAGDGEFDGRKPLPISPTMAQCMMDL